jgi:hypothetical protein
VGTEKGTGLERGGNRKGHGFATEMGAVPVRFIEKPARLPREKLFLKPGVMA